MYLGVAAARVSVTGLVLTLMGASGAPQCAGAQASTADGAASPIDDTQSLPETDFNPPNAPPRIPTQDFDWNGRFVADDLGVNTDLTIQGKWQDGYFDLYMQQGHRGSREKVWVENLLYKNKFYSITHEWPVGTIPTDPHTGEPLCFGSVNDITVDGLNGILQSSRLVGLEIIDGVKMNHFRATCLSETLVFLIFPVRLDVFSDLYVRPNRPEQLERWLQFGDAVGLDPQHDEWFLLDEHDHHPNEIRLPRECRKPVPVYQKKCSNLPDP